MDKRSALEVTPNGSDPSPKRPKYGSGKQVALRTSTNGNALVSTGPSRNSSLMSPAMQLTNGHNGEIYCAAFDHSGNRIAAGSLDRKVSLWNTFGTCDNYGCLSGHKNAVLDLSWSKDDSKIYCASADTTLSQWDVDYGTRIRQFKGHTDIVNSLSVLPFGVELLLSGSDDGHVGLWDSRSKNAIDFLKTPYPVTAVCFSNLEGDLFAAGIDPQIKAMDFRNKKTLYTLDGNDSTVTSLQVSPSGNSLLSNSMDNNVRIFNIMPFAPGDRAMGVYEGAPFGIEKNLLRACWSPDEMSIAAGSSNRTAVVWDVPSRQISYRVAGHIGCVNAVAFHPKEKILLTASTDRTMILSELPR